MFCVKMDRLIYAVVAIVFMLEGAIFQTVLQSDLEWKSFSGCCSETGCQQAGSPNYYRYLAVSDDGKNLWVGAMNFLIKLDINNLTCESSKYLPVSDYKITRCKVQGKSEVPDCQNHIRTVIELNDEDLYVCGTGGYSPVNYTFNRRAVTVSSSKPGSAYCPYDPLDNSTAIKIDHGNPWNSSALYFGTYTDFIKNFPVFFRPKHSAADGKHYLKKTTDTEDIKYLYSPQFVGSFDEDDSVFFFFREIAIETPVDNRQIFSRVGKVCKKDEGGGTLEMSRSTWLSFQKARLNCSLPGNVPFYFDDVYDVYKSGDYFYALFYKQAAFLSTSAICIYKKADILKAFQGRFQYKNANDNWVTLRTDPSPRLDNCSLFEGGNTNFDQLSSKYQLMDSAVKPVFGQPIFHQQSVQLLKIAVSETQNNARNIYVASDKGKVYDIFFKEGASESLSDSVVRLNKIYEPFPESNKSYAVWNMKLLDDAVILGTDYNVTRLNLDVCASIQNIDTCIFDTRCAWNKCEKRCMTKTNYQISTCVISHTEVSHDKSILSLLIDLEAIERVQEVTRQGITGIYTTLEVLYPISRKASRWKRSLPDQPESEINMEKEVFKYALSYKGDLMIANTTFEDAGRYKAYDQDNTLIADYRLNVIESTDHLIDAWKQQFADWSTAFVRWKHCSNDFFQGCVKRP